MKLQTILLPLLFSFLFLPVSIAGTGSEARRLMSLIEEIDASNRALMGAEDESGISTVLKDKQVLMDKLFTGLVPGGTDSLVRPDRAERLSFLKARISTNRSRGNHVAVRRDRVELDTLKVRARLYEFIAFLIHSKNTYNSKANIVAHAEKELSWLEEIVAPEDPGTVLGSVGAALMDNLGDLRTGIATYTDILHYTLENPSRIATLSWFAYIRLGAVIDRVNDAESVAFVNRLLLPLALDTGRCAVSILLFLLFYLLAPTVSKTGRKIVTFIIESRLENTPVDDFINDIKQPIKAMIGYLALDLATSALFYKTRMEPSIREVNYIVYTTLLIYFLFRLTDALAIIGLERVEQEQRPLRKEFINLSIRFSKFIILVTGLSIVLNHFGIRMTAILSTLGIGGIAFALAAKDTLSNLFGGITILLDDIFRQGDWICVNELEGTVVEVGLRSTTLRTFDNALVTVPNSTIATREVRNWDRREVGRRIKMNIRLTYDSDLKDVANAIEDIRAMLRNHPDISAQHPRYGRKKKRSSKLISQEDLMGIKHNQMVYLDRFGDYSMDILVYAFSRSTGWSSWLETKEDILYRIHGIVLDNNLSFAYPTEARIFRPEPVRPESFKGREPSRDGRQEIRSASGTGR